MAIATINKSLKRSGKGELFVFERPTTIPAGATIAQKLSALLVSVMYEDAKLTTLKAGVNAFANITANGFSTKVKQTPLEFESNTDSKETIAIIDTDITGEFEFADINPAHIATVMNANQSELISVAAASGSAGREQVGLGAEMYLTPYVLVYKMPSALFAGQFDHYVYTKATWTVDTDLKNSKKEVSTIKVMFSCQGDEYFQAANGLYLKAFADMATVAPLV